MGRKTRDGCCHFRCLSYHRADEEGLISSPLARQDGVKSWISRPICTSPPPPFPLYLLSFAYFLFSFPFLFFFLALFAHYSTVGAWKMLRVASLPLLFSPWPFSTRREIVRVLLRNVNAEPLTLSGQP